MDADLLQNIMINAHHINSLSSDELDRLHGPKMNGPRNETERVLLDINELSRQILNKNFE
jgi:hypothetical protein